MQQILIIEDDRALNQGLCKALKTDNNSIQVCSGLYASATDRQIVSCENLKDAKEQLLCGVSVEQLFFLYNEVSFAKRRISILQMCSREL